MKLHEYIKEQNKRVSKRLSTSKYYWMRSPSNILLYRAAHSALKRYGKGSRVLDAGAGKLAYRTILKMYFKTYISSDFNRTHPELDVITNVEKMSFKSSFFDTVFCSQVLEHVPHPWLALSEIYRVLRPGGVAIITVPMLGYIHNAPYDFFRYTEFGLRNLAEDAGFTVVCLKSVGGFFCFLGYVRSTFLMPVMAIPVFGKIALYINYCLSIIDIELDKATHNSKIFPLNYIIVMRK